MTIREILIRLGFDLDESSRQDAEQGINSLKNMAAKALGAIGIGFSIAGISSAINDCVELSSEVEEMQNKFDVVFQGMTDEVEEWAKSYADAIGRNANDIKTYLADQQNLLVGFGMTRQEGAELSKQMTTLALDLASFANLDETSAVDNMTKAVMGESEAAKALGAVINDVTRDQAMQALGLSGTYDSLDQLTKMQVNYQAILAQSPDAIGDCERSLGSYRSTVISFQSKLKEIKTLVGQFFMPTFQKVISFGVKGLTVLRDVVQRLSDFAAKIGGADRILAVLGVTIAATLAIVNFQKIANGLKLIGKGLSSVNLKIFAIAAAVLLVVLLIQDFIAFMNGENSVIGTLFEKAGVDCDKLRKNIIQIWENIKTVLSAIWQGIKNVAIPVFQGIWEAIKSVFEAIRNIIAKVAPEFAEFIDELANGEIDTQKWVEVGEAIAKITIAIAGAVVAVKTIIAVVKTAISVVKGVSAAISFLSGPVGLAIAAIAALIAIGVLLWKNWDEVKAFALSTWTSIQDSIAGALTGIKDFFFGTWGSVMEFLSGIWSGIIAAVSSALSTVLGTVTGKFSAILRFITSTATKILNMLTSTFTNLWRSITNTVGNIKTSIINGFQTAINWIRSLPGQAIQWGADIINGIVDGIRGAIGRVGDAAKDVAGKITSFLHFSRPDEGPLAEYESWMPDFVGGLAQGIRAGIPVIRSAVKELSGNMRIDAAPVFNGNQTENAVPPAETAAPNAIPKKERLQISAAVPAKEPQMQRMDAGRKVWGEFVGNVEKLVNIVDFVGKEFANSVSTFRSVAGNILETAARAATVSPDTAALAEGRGAVYNIHQYVDISNQFHGDRAGQEKSSFAMDKAAADATSEMARALKFARG